MNFTKMQGDNILDYIKEQFKTGGMIKKIILANAIVFALLLILKVVSKLFLADGFFEGLLDQLIMPGTFTGILYKPWTLITALFVHITLWHFFFNILIFYFSSKMFVQFFGETRLFSTYLVGGIFGGVIHVLSYLMFPFFENQVAASVYGASGAIYAVLGALIFYKPQFKVKLFLALEIPLWVLGFIMFFSDFINLTSADGTAHFVHLGGGLFGVLSVLGAASSSHFMNKIDKLLSMKFTFKKQPKMKVYRNTDAKKMTDDEYNLNKSNKQKKMDAILDKISANGYESLSKTEKDFLFKFGNE
jgi:membrane associated rhomboid family serine protease